MTYNEEQCIHDYFHLGKSAQSIGLDYFAYRCFRICLFYYCNVELSTLQYYTSSALPGLAASAFKRIDTCRSHLSERRRKKLEEQEKIWRVKDSFYHPKWKTIVLVEKIRLWFCYLF